MTTENRLERFGRMVIEERNGELVASLDGFIIHLRAPSYRAACLLAIDHAADRFRNQPIEGESWVQTESGAIIDKE